jgi:FtsH-binding integral membrane protein
MKFILKVFVACLVGFAMMCIAIAYDASDRLAIASYFATAIAVAAVLGAFDESAKSKHMSLKDGARHYDQAA